MAKNILFITIDSLRQDHLSVFDHDPNHTKTFNSLIADGVSFTRAFATGPGTRQSFPAILTGTYLLSYQGVGKLSPERPRVAKNLQSHGLSTAGFQSNPFLSEQFNYHVGFDTYRDYQNPLMGVATRVFPRGIEVNNPRLKTIDDILGLTDKLKRAYQLVSGKARPYVGADVITDDTLEWLDNTESPFFCWTHYMDVHHPCFPPQKYRERYDVGDVTVGQVSDWYSALINDPERLTKGEIDALLALYDAAIEYVDTQINRLVEQLKQTGRYEETLIIITSDHGEMFGEHGEHGKPHRMYDELLRVPLIVANGPGYLESAADELVSLIDIPPLLHDALDLEVPEEYEGQIPGKSEPRMRILGEDEIKGQPVIGARSEESLYEYDANQEIERVYEVRDGTAIPTTDHAPTPELRDIVSHRLNQFDGSTDYDLKSEIDDDMEARLEDLGYL